MTSWRILLCLQHWCLVLSLFLYFGRAHGEFKLGAPNTEGWINPDNTFAPSLTLKPDRAEVSEQNIAECQESLKKWIEKYSDCEKGLLIQSPNDCVKVKELVPRPEITSPEPCAAEKSGAKVFLQRFIHLLLEFSNLNNKELQTNNRVELMFSLSDHQIATLRQFAEEGNTKSVPLRKLDDIFSSVFVKPYFILPNVESIFNSLPRFDQFKIGSFFLSAVLPILWFISVLFLTRSIAKSFVWLVPVVFLTSYITTASQMFEEAQASQYELFKQYADAPKHCSSPSLWQLLFGLSGNDCSNFLKAHQLDPNLGITPVKVFVKMFGETVAESMKHFGSGSVEFFGKFEEMGFFAKLTILPLASALLYAVFVLVCIASTGGSIRLPYFMGSLNFHNSNNNASTSGTSATTASQRVEALPSSNITVNFNQVPENPHALLQSISQFLNLPSTSDQHFPALADGFDPPSVKGEVRDDCGSGDHPSTLLHRPLGRPNVSGGAKKQFSQLESKYKFGHKTSSKLSAKRARHISL